MPTRPIPFGGDDAHTFAAQLLSFGEGLAPHLPAAAFRIPRFQLTVASDSGSYLAMCRRALIDDPVAPSDRDLRIVVADYETHPEMPRGEWRDTMFGPLILARGLQPAGFDGSLNLDEQLVQFFDPATGIGVEALVRPGQFPPWIESFPLRNFLHWAYQAIGWRVVHAGTLSVNGRGVLLAGVGGAGKSGTVLAGVTRGLDSAGDDYVAMEVTEEGVRAYPVTRLMKQDKDGLSRVGLDANDLGLENWQGKHEFDFETLGAGKRARQIHLAAILLPRVAGSARTAIRPATPREAMMTMAPNNLRQLPDGWREGLAFTADVSRRLPAYHLDLGTNPDEIADVVAGIIAEHS